MSQTAALETLQDSDSVSEATAKDVAAPTPVAEPAAISTTEKEKFIPVTRFAILDRLDREEVWREGEYESIRTFLAYFNAWRHQGYSEQLLRLKEAYLPFSPDRDTVRVLRYTDKEMAKMQKRVTKAITELLTQANYQEITQDDINAYFAAKSPYSLELKVDLSEFDEVIVFCRGSDNITRYQRTAKSLYLKKEALEIPIFQRLFLLLKLKPEEERVREIMSAKSVNEVRARRILQKNRKNLPKNASPNHIYLKLFKRIHQSDLEMLFPNTKVAFKPFDKIKFAVTAGGGTATSIVGIMTKIFAATNPIALLGALAALGGLIFRQIMSFFNQRAKYMMVLAQNLYFHNLANNRGVLTLLVDRAEEEDVKEDLLLYAYLSQYKVPKQCLMQAKMAIEQFLENEFNVSVDYDIEDSLGRLLHDGLVRETEDGVLTSLRPPECAKHLETLWKECVQKKIDEQNGEG